MLTPKHAQNNTARETAIILLAAGKSTRFVGSNKLSQELFGIPLLTHCYNNIKYSNVAQIVVVSSQENLKQAETLSNPYPKIGFVENNELGMGHSISIGMSCIQKEISSIIICLADMPLVTNTHIQLLLEANKSSSFKQIHRLYDVNNLLGHPILFNSYFFLKLKRLKGDKGAYNIISDNKDLINIIKVNNLSVSTDIDTNDDWNNLIL